LSSLALQNISKTFHTTEAVRGVNLDVRAGEFFSILGPSGCGKTTLLRIVAGFEKPTTGSVIIDGVDVTHRPPRERGVGMVFQNYALFPHMTVYENVAFGLETKKLSPGDIRRRVEAILEAVHLTDKIDTPVPHLSGGEQQRVAVARALVVEPAVLLFDEPLSNLDVALRVKTREEIRTLQRRFGITAIYVTHDQSEAMSLSDRIAVMRQGRIEQVGTPSAMYESPRSAFVAAFLGGANILTGKVEAGRHTLRVGSFHLPLPGGIAPSSDGNVTLAIKPEGIVLTMPPEGEPTGIVKHREYLGFVTSFVVEAGGITLNATAISSAATEQMVPGSVVGLRFDRSRCTLLEPE